jgi:hypothetical protein
MPTWKIGRRSRTGPSAAFARPSLFGLVNENCRLIDTVGAGADPLAALESGEVTSPFVHEYAGT